MQEREKNEREKGTKKIKQNQNRSSNQAIYMHEGNHPIIMTIWIYRGKINIELEKNRLKFTKSI